MTRPSLRPFALAASAVLAIACGAETERVALGPVDGHDLPPADTGRVAVGDPAPDFSLEAYPEGVITLSQFRGKREVILVFYRGSW